MKQIKSSWLIVAAVALFIALGVLYLFSPKNSANVNVVASPSAAKIIIDSTKELPVGKVYVPAGRHRLVASFYGFTAKTIDFSATQTLSEIDVVLEPNSQAGYDWLNNHPEDVNVRQRVGGIKYDKSAQNQLKQAPIIGDLPYFERYFRVDYGASKAHPDDGKATALYITYYANIGKQQALDWIKQKGYDPSSFEIIYLNQTSTE